MKAPKPKEGYVDRGMVMRAYPTPEQVAKIEAMQPSLRACWNWLVSRIEEPLAAKEARAIREGLMPPPVPKPCYDGLENEEKQILREKYKQECTDRRKKIYDLPIPVDWRPFLSGKGSEAERLGLKEGSGVLNNYLRFKGLPTLPVAILRKLEDNFNTTGSRQKRKKFRRECDAMPIQVKAGPRLRLRKPKRNDGWYQRRCNAEVNLPRAGWIAVYLDPGLMKIFLAEGNKPREGCTLKYKQGRWYASVKIQRPEVMHSGPSDNSSIGIDPGLDMLVSTSDKFIIPGTDKWLKNNQLKNPRNRLYMSSRSLALSIISSGDSSKKFLDKETRREMAESVYRFDTKQNNRVHTQLRQLAAYLCDNYQFIGIEENNGKALGIGSKHYTGVTRTLYSYLVERCGTNRVRLVDPHYNSQDCSQCGHRDKIAWERKIGQQNQICACLNCGYVQNRDINAARNVNRKLRKELGLDDT